jgi:hypothetical protein
MKRESGTEKMPPIYSEHYDTIVALVTYLAVLDRRGEKSGRSFDNASVKWLAGKLGLPEAEIEFVLENFKGLFQKAHKPFEGEYHYSLLLRYSHRIYHADEDPEYSKPLPDEALFDLLDFISNRVAMEQEEAQQRLNNRNQLVAMLVASLSAVVAAAASIVAVLIR